MKVQNELAAIPGVTVLIYDQTCAAEKRRRRKRGAFPDPDKRVIINELVCEGCGDCGVQSNCVSVQPLETEFGRKRTIDQSSCNKDFSCVKGFCPSFVTVDGAKPKKARRDSRAARACRHYREPALPAIDRPTACIVTGVGGTGIVTIGAHPRHGGASRRQGRRRHRHGGPRAEGRRGATATSASPRSPKTFTPSASRRAAPISCSAATSWSPAPRRCWPRSSRAPPRW